MKDKITKDLIDKYFSISNISSYILNQQYTSAVLCGEFSELVLKYLLRKYTDNDFCKTHNLSFLFSLLNKSIDRTLGKKVHSILDKLPRETIYELKFINYTNFKYKEIPEHQLDAIKQVFKVCQELYIYLICRNQGGI